MTHPSTRILVLGAGIAGLLFTLRLAGRYFPYRWWIIQYALLPA
jgi:protoporphyrinogen oxidase